MLNPTPLRLQCLKYNSKHQASTTKQSMLKSKLSQPNFKPFSSAATATATNRHVETGTTHNEAAEAADVEVAAVIPRDITYAVIVKNRDIFKRCATHALGPERRRSTPKANPTPTQTSWTPRTARRARQCTTSSKTHGNSNIRSS